MKLTFKRQEKNKKRLSIFCGEEYLFSVSEYTYFKENLYDGMETDDFEALKKRCDISEFTNYALNIMSRHIYTKKTLKGKLLAKGCPVDTADKIIEELIEKKILSDDTYKQNFIYESQRYKKNGIKRIKEELYFKGITANDEDFDHDLEKENAKELTASLLEKNTDPKKIINKLMNKGYNYSQIKESLNNIETEEFDYYE